MKEISFWVLEVRLEVNMLPVVDEDDTETGIILGEDEVDVLLKLTPTSGLTLHPEDKHVLS